MASPDEPTTSLTSIVEHSVAALRALAEVAEAVDDEAQYIADLVTVSESRMRSWVAGPGSADALVEPRSAAAVASAIAETRLVTDAHRAIDWLSTFPQVVGLALGRRL